MLGLSSLKLTVEQELIHGVSATNDHNNTIRTGTLWSTVAYIITAALLCGWLQFLNFFGTGVAYVVTTSTCMIAIQKSNCYHKEGQEATYQVVFDKVAEINASKESWNIRVKVVMLWKPTYINNPNMVASLDMILIDQEGSRIQATIKKILFLYLNPYSMKELSGRSVTSLWLAMKANTCLSLINIKSISTKPQKNFDTRVAFDFLGEVVSTDPMRVIVEYGREKRLMNLVAQDLSGTRIAVALWGSFAMKLNTYISQHNNDTAPVIILLRLAKLKIWGGQPQVGNCLFGSRLHINDDMPQILEFKSNLNALDTNVESSSRTSQLNSDTVVANPEDYYLRFQIKNIDEIPDFNEEVGLTIIATIIGFDMDDGWYSFYCRDCSKKVTKNDDDVDAGPFHCDGCGFVSDVFGKIRIVVRVQDESGSSSFVLFERHVKDLIHRGNQWLMDKIAKDQGRQQIPDEFKILLNKKFVFKVQISMFNLQNNYRAYTVHKLTDDERVLAEVTKRSPNHQHDNINDNGTPINKSNKENTNSVHDDNLDVVDLEAVTPSSSTGKRPIEIDANADSLEWSSSKTCVVRDTLKIPKLEKLD
ncbi:unnamed protein product [Lactuca virosa]|uniref:Replication factor A C-terminal domain-containing protein n=1 Tax=Lactuca virosa TaxID=75947 RepID=A0AAU9NBS1_9ASTR|nr:unnamed protein product [Lactuca virosa]